MTLALLRSFVRMTAALMLCLIATVSVAEELLLTSPPRGTQEVEAKLYGPLAAHLSKLLGVKVTYRYPDNWLVYQRDMRNNVYDIVFDGPHFAAWRMAHLGHKTVVKLPGTLQFHLLRRAADEAIKSPNDLIGKKICGLPPPNLATLSVLAYYDNPARQPVIVGVPEGFGAVFKKLLGGACEAAVVRSVYHTKGISDEERAKVKLIHESMPLPNQAITVSTRVSADGRRKIAESLTIGEGVAVAEPIVKSSADKGVKSFVLATDEEFEGLNALLEGVIFGW